VLSKMKIARIATVPFSLTTQLNSTLVDIENAGTAVTVIFSDDSQLGVALDEIEVSQRIKLDFSRDINPIKRYYLFMEIVYGNCLGFLEKINLTLFILQHLKLAC